jgi:hypothetical protein
MRVHAMLGETEEDREIRELVELIERLGGTITTRKLQRHSRKYRTAEEAENALQILVQHEKGDWRSRPATAQGGRPSTEFILRRVDTTPAKECDLCAALETMGFGGKAREKSVRLPRGLDLGGVFPSAYGITTFQRQKGKDAICRTLSSCGC